ncbi:hypothetical protein D3C85_1599380 [compost metagenome]
MTAMQHADELPERITVLQIHAVFTRHRQRFDDAGSRIFQLTLQVIVTVHNKEDAQQQTDQDGRGENQNHHARAQAVVGHGVPLWDN